MVIVTDIKQKKQEVFTARTDRKDQFRKSLHADALVDASQNAAGAEKNTADGGGVKYSIKNTSTMTLEQQLKLYYAGKLKSSDSL